MTVCNIVVPFRVRDDSESALPQQPLDHHAVAIVGVAPETIEAGGLGGDCEVVARHCRTLARSSFLGCLRAQPTSAAGIPTVSLPATSSRASRSMLNLRTAA